MHIIKRLVLGFVFGGMVFGVALAQPEVEKTWGDWSKICTPPAEGQEGDEICSISQTATMNEGGLRLLETTIRYVEGNEKPVMFVLVPLELGLYLPRGLTVTVDDLDPVTIALQRCTVKGCIAVLAMEENLVEAFRKAEQAQIVFFIDVNQSRNLPVSLDGFTRAFRSLQ